MIQENKMFSKVFMWMFIGLAITFGVGYYVSLNETMLYNIFSKYYMLLIVAELIVIIVLSARINKLNPMVAKILFCLYSFLTGLTFSSIFVLYHITSIIYIFGITSIIFLIFAFIGYFANVDLTKFGTYLFMVIIGVIICGIINIFVGSETFNLLLAIICLIVFIAYVGYDVQVIKRKLYNIDDIDNFAIFGALQLYLDFINIFLSLLQIFGNSKD